jgi:hypothetical protein
LATVVHSELLLNLAKSFHGLEMELKFMRHGLHGLRDTVDSDTAPVETLRGYICGLIDRIEKDIEHDLYRLNAIHRQVAEALADYASH